MTIKIKFILLIPALLLLSAACGTTVPVVEEETVIRVGVLTGPTAMSLIPLIAHPPLLESGGKKYRLQFSVKAAPQLLRAQLLQGKPDMAVIPTTLAAVLYNKGLPYRAVAVPVWGTLVLMGKMAEAPQPFDWNVLKGREVHLMGKGMTPDVLFQLLLKSKNLEPGKDVTFNYRFPAPRDLAQAMAGGIVEWAVLSEPMAGMTASLNREVSVLADLSAEWKKAGNGEIPQAVLVVKQSFLLDHPELTELFLKRYESATQRVNQDPQAAGVLIAQQGITADAGIGARAIPRCNLRLRRMPNVKEQVKAYLRLFFQWNPVIIGGRLPDEGFYYQP